MKVSRAKTSDLVDEALNLLSMYPQYGEPWIVFDRDRVKNFDSIIHDAKVNGVKVGWSNPCIEIWFHAYFGKMRMCSDSGACCKDFEMSYLNAVKQKYVKSDRNIYTKLCQYGDEIRALQIAKRKYEEHQRHGVELPSDMCPCTTLNVLVEEIKKKAGD